jgi:uncharacterized metal-binding protein
METTQSDNSQTKPIVYSCSGCSDAGELADRVARELNARGVAEMSCLAGVGGRVKPLMLKAQRAQEIVVIDGCPLNCARHTLINAGITNFQHVALQTLGQRKGSCPVTPGRVESVTASVEKIIHSEKTQVPA